MVSLTAGKVTKALTTGVTDTYVGSTYHDHWSSRVIESTESPRFDLEIALAAYQKPKLSPAQVDELCNVKGLDPSDNYNRRNVGYVYHRDHHDKWVNAGSGAEPNQQAPSRKRPHTVAVGDDQPTTPPTSAPKKTTLLTLSPASKGRP